jgi:hypothetical protein
LLDGDCSSGCDCPSPPSGAGLGPVSLPCVAISPASPASPASPSSPSSPSSPASPSPTPTPTPSPAGCSGYQCTFQCNGPSNSWVVALNGCNIDMGCFCVAPASPCTIVNDGQITNNNCGGMGIMSIQDTKDPNEIEFRLNLVENNSKNRSYSVVQNNNAELMSISKSKDITIYNQDSSNSFIITSKPVSQEISPINKIENKNQIGNIQIPKNEHIPFTPVNLNVAINIDMNFSKSVKITIPKEDEVISLGENIRKLDEIKQKLVFDKIPKNEKINSPLTE